jgi:hypothetical protein
MTNFKCKDYYIIKVRIYASKYLLDKYHSDKNNRNKPYPKQHRDRAVQYTKFFWEFFTHVTGINDKDWYFKYMFNARECALEELQDKYGILTSDAEAERIFLIPKEKEDLFEWFKENVGLPYKVVSVLKYLPLSFRYSDNYDLGNLRQESEEFTKKQKEKFGIKDGEE